VAIVLEYTSGVLLWEEADDEMTRKRAGVFAHMPANSANGKTEAVPMGVARALSLNMFFN
jgi:hypothetical protein